MPDSNPDPPETLSAAEQTFRSFLATQKYPETVCWLMPGDLVIDTNRHYWARKRGVKQSETATLRYGLGTKRNLGILLEAICATETETFARVFVPEDDIDAQYHLLGRGLRLSCPVEKCRTSAVSNPLYWLLLRLRYGKRSKMLAANQKASMP